MCVLCLLVYVVIEETVLKQSIWMEELCVYLIDVMWLFILCDIWCCLFKLKVIVLFKTCNFTTVSLYHTSLLSDARSQLLCWETVQVVWICVSGRTDGWNMGGKISSCALRRLQFYNDTAPAEAGSDVASRYIDNWCVSKHGCCCCW